MEWFYNDNHDLYLSYVIFVIPQYTVVFPYNLFSYKFYF